MERETKKTKMEPGHDLDMQVDKLESLVALQQQTEKLKMIKTEEAIDCSENQIVTGLKKKIHELENQVLEKDLALESYRDRMQGLEKEIEKSKRHVWMDSPIIKEMKSKHLDLELSMELLRQKNVEANRTVEELTRKLSACKEEKMMADWIQEDMRRRESENVLYVEDLRQQNSKASQSIEELRRRISVCEEEKKCSDYENVRRVDELKRQNLEAAQTVDELRRRVSACEEEKKMGDRVQEEMKRRESENIRCVEQLRDRILACEEEKKMADRVQEEMKVRESDLRSQLSRAEQDVKELKERGLEACKAAEVNVERFGNVVPIAEDLCKLLRMNVEDLMSVKDKFVSAGFGDEATTAHRGEGGPYPSKALKSTNSEQSTKSKKRYSPETQITPSSAAVIIDCGDDEKFVSSLSYENSLVVPKRKRSKRMVVVNKSLVKRKWMYGAEMVRAFEEDDELCLHAVCALYRQHVSTSKSDECQNRRFYHFEALRGRVMAVYLIGGDPKFKLTRSVDEVKQQYPYVVNQSRRLAICYSSYFTAMPRTHEPLSSSRSLPLLYVGACETYCSEGEGKDVEPVSDL